MLYFIVFLSAFSVLSAKEEITFKNVEVQGYNVFTLKFTKTIEQSSSLKENLPKVYVDHISFVNQIIPVLHENSISDINNLDELTIENCQLEKIHPGALSNLPMLRKITIKENKLKEIENGVFNGMNVSMLDLSSNRLKTIEASAFDNLPSLLNIKLADNNIALWDKRWFQNCPFLTRISMQNNSIEQLPQDAFTNLNDQMKYGRVLMTLNLIFSHNKINRINEKAFTGINKLGVLWLDHNDLKDFNENILKHVEVRDLRLGDNQIVCFEGDLANIIRGESNDLDANPFDCACLEKIKEWKKNTDKKVDIFFSDMDCATKRMRQKMDDISKLLKTMKRGENEQKKSETNKNLGDVELIFK